MQNCIKMELFNHWQNNSKCKKFISIVGLKLDRVFYDKALSIAFYIKSNF